MFKQYSNKLPDFALQSATLKYNNKNMCNLGSVYCKNKLHPATYICITKDNKISIALLKKAGTTYPKTYDDKCKTIMNLDGGGSSTLYFPEKNITYLGRDSFRRVPDAILIFQKDYKSQQINSTKKTTNTTTQYTTQIKKIKTIKKITYHSFCEVNNLYAKLLCQIEKMNNTFFIK